MNLPTMPAFGDGSLPVGCPIEASILEAEAARYERLARENEADLPDIITGVTAYLRTYAAKIRIEVAKGRSETIVTLLEGMTTK